MQCLRYLDFFGVKGTKPNTGDAWSVARCSSWGNIFFDMKSQNELLFCEGREKNVSFVMGDKRIAGMCIFLSSRSTNVQR